MILQLSRSNSIQRNEVFYQHVVKINDNYIIILKYLLFVDIARQAIKTHWEFVKNLIWCYAALA